MAHGIAQTFCPSVAHREIVLTIPKRLRVYFRFDCRLLGGLDPLGLQRRRQRPSGSGRPVWTGATGPIYPPLPVLAWPASCVSRKRVR